MTGATPIVPSSTSLTSWATLPVAIATTWPTSLTAARTEFPFTPIAGRQHRGTDRLLNHVARSQRFPGKAGIVRGITMDLEHGIPLMASMVCAGLSVR